MTAYAGQTETGGIELLQSEQIQGLTTDMLFTEQDRRKAHEALQHNPPVLPEDLYGRLSMLAMKGSHQARWYINRLIDSQAEQTTAIVENT